MGKLSPLKINKEGRPSVSHSHAKTPTAGKRRSGKVQGFLDKKTLLLEVGANNQNSAQSKQSGQELLNKLQQAFDRKSKQGGGLAIGGNFANKPFLEKLKILSEHLTKVKERQDREKEEKQMKEMMELDMNKIVTGSVTISPQPIAGPDIMAVPDLANAALKV